MSETDPGLLVSDFDYELPTELIAQTPLSTRDESRLLVLNRETGAITHSKIRSLPKWLISGDLIVANNSRVIPARLNAVRMPTGGHIEFLLLSRKFEHIWSALARPSKKLRIGDRLELQSNSNELGDPSRIEVVQKGEEGLVGIRFIDAGDDDLGRFGSVPLPPYIHEQIAEPERYQTTYASISGSAAAPTAGLHFTPELRQSLQSKGIGWSEVTLHIGLDTFRPVTVERAVDHRIHSEWCHVPAETLEAIFRTRDSGGRVMALGTTTARALETLGQRSDFNEVADFEAATTIFITPGYKWTAVDGLITNFHLPRSTLLMMVSAFAGRESVLAAYKEAIEQQYRFFSFGDAMLIV